MGNRVRISSTRRIHRHGRTGAALAIALLAGSLTALTPMAAEAAPGSPSRGASDASSGAPQAASADAVALAQAERTGKSVPVTADTTDESTTQANPNGSYTYTATAEPTQVKQNGTWVGIDTTLRRDGDGTLAPAAAASSVVFSGGGTAPLVTLTSAAGQRMSLSWPSALPTPTVSGATATYPDVYPGVNLAMTATVYGGYTEQLIVTSATAAANPALRDIHFVTKTSGLTLRSTSAGGLQANDASGHAVFTSPTATMWSTPTHAAAAAGGRIAAALTTATGSTGGAAAPGADAPAAKVGVQVTNNGLDLQPPAAALTGTKISYPVVIDPSVSPAINGNDWTWVSETDADTSYWQGGNNSHDSDAHVGYDDWCSDGYGGCASSAFGVTRSLFSMDTTILAGKHVTGATFSVDEQGPTSSESGTRQIDLRGAGAFSSGTTWNNQPTPWGTVAASANFDSLNNTGIGSGNFDVTSLIQSAVAAGYHTQTMVLEADNESDDTAYRYMIGNGTNDPKLEVDYYSTPDVPNDMSVTNGTRTLPCAADGSVDTAAPGYWINASDSKSVTLNVGLSSPDSGTPVTGEFWYHETAPTAPAHWTEVVASPVNAAADDASTMIHTDMPTLTDGETFQWQAYASEDSGTYSTTAGPSTADSCWFSVDLTPPTLGTATATPPTAAGGAPGTLAVTATDGGTDPSGVAQFLYNMNGTSLTAGGDGEQSIASTGSATIPLTAEHWGTNTVWYTAEDAAGNIATPTSYSFYVAPGAYVTGTAGDLSGDGKPDLAAIDSSGNIDLYSNPLSDTPSGSNTGSLLIPAADAASTTGASSFTGALIAHSGSTHGQNCDDLDIVQHANLLVEQNNNCLITSPNNTWTPVDGQRPPAPAAGTPTAAATAYDSSDWGQVQQLLALSAPETNNGSTDLVTTDLVTLELSGGTEYLWEFPMNGPAPEAPTLLASGSAWSGVDLINAGLINGSPALFTRNISTGAVTEYQNLNSDTTNTLTGTTIATGGYSSATYPLLTGAGEVGPSSATSGPALWAVDASGTLQLIPTSIAGNGNATILDPEAMTASAWGTSLSAIS